MGNRRTPWWAIANFFREHRLPHNQQLSDLDLAELNVHLSSVSNGLPEVYTIEDKGALRKGTSKYFNHQNLKELIDDDEQWKEEFDGFPRPGTEKEEVSAGFLKTYAAEFKLDLDTSLVRQKHTLHTENRRIVPESDLLLMPHSNNARENGKNQQQLSLHYPDIRNDEHQQADTAPRSPTTPCPLPSRNLCPASSPVAPKQPILDNCLASRAPTNVGKTYQASCPPRLQLGDSLHNSVASTKGRSPQSSPSRHVLAALPAAKEDRTGRQDAVLSTRNAEHENSWAELGAREAELRSREETLRMRMAENMRQERMARQDRKDLDAAKLDTQELKHALEEMREGLVAQQDQIREQSMSLIRYQEKLIAKDKEMDLWCAKVRDELCDAAAPAVEGGGDEDERASRVIAILNRVLAQSRNQT